MKNWLAFAASILFFFGMSLNAGFDQAELNAYAKDYGNKAANLKELEKIASSIEAVTPFEVPSFLPISHGEIVSFLKNKRYNDQSVYTFIMDQWEEFKKGQPRESHALTDQAKAALGSIREAITHAFSGTLSLDDTFKEKLTHFIDAADEKDALLMVRSSGREDSKELANAGGNETIASVKPDAQSILEAMGIVIASYFSEQSIGQRLAAGDEKLYEDPFMPVLLQVMVGEKPGGSEPIPTSGVIFSQEAEGRTPGVTQIQATYGQGEGVVNGLVPVDTFYVGGSKIIHPLISIKPERMITARDGKTSETKENPKALRKIPSLTSVQIKSLKIGADVIQNYYGYPVDIEFVAQGNKIFLVQTRPLQEPEVTPSYIKSAYFDQLHKEDIQEVFVIGAAGGKVHIVESAKEVIVAANIRDALKEFLRREDKADVKAVIINEMAPATSHEATNFRANNKPVLFAQDLTKIKSWIEKEALPLLIDTQRNAVVRFERLSEFESAQSTIEEDSWFVHPIPAKMSIFSNFFSPLTPEQIKNIEPKKLYEGIKSSTLIEYLKNAESSTAVGALKSLLYRVVAALTKEQSKQEALKKAKKETDPQLVQRLTTISKALFQAAYEYIESLERWEGSDKTTRDRLIRLYPVQWIEALIRQIPYKDIFVNDYSFTSLLKVERLEEATVKELGLEKKALRAFIAQYAKAEVYGLTPMVKDDWKKFLKNIAQSRNEELQKNFAELMYTLARFEALPLWLNSSFYEATGKEKDSQSVAQSLIEDYKAVKGFMADLTAVYTKLKAFNPAVFESPKTFEEQLKLFTKNLYDYFSGEKFRRDFKDTNDFGKRIALSVMGQFVAQFDTAIKALTGSTLYENLEQKVENFQAFLYPYENLLKTWSELLDKEVLDSLVDAWTFKTFDDNWNVINSIITKVPLTANQLQGSGGFNVSAAALGSKADWGVSIGISPSLEDMFTLIHQNLLILLSLLNKKLAESMSIPELLQQTLEYAKEMSVVERGQKTPARLISIDFEYPNLTYHFNQPLRHHSATFKLIYNMQKNSLSFVGKFMGLNEEDRWGKIKLLISIFAQAANIDLESVDLDVEKGGIEFALSVKKLEDAQKTIQVFKVFAQGTLLGIIGLADDVLKDISTILGEGFDENELYDLTLQKLNNNPEYISLIPMIDPAQNQKAISMLERTLRDATKNNNSALIRRALDIFERLVRKKQAFKEAKKAAQKAIESKDDNVISSGLSLLIALVNQGKAFKEATEWALQAINSSNAEVVQNALSLFETLVYKGQAFKEATEWALQAINSSNVELVQNALSLFTDLVYKGQAFKEAEEAAQKAVETQNAKLIRKRLVLLQSLVNKGQAFKEAKEAAQKATESKDTSLINLGLSIFGSLVNKGQAFTEAKGAAQKAIESKDSYVIFYGVSIFELLVDKGQALQEAKKAAQKVLQKNFPKFIDNQARILVDLVEEKEI